MLKLKNIILITLIFFFSGCIPGIDSNQQASEKLLVFPGGWIIGRWVHQEADIFSLPASPQDADADGKVLGIIYTFSWQRYKDGLLEDEVSLPFSARYLHARPAWVVILEKGLYTEASGWLDYPAQDAVNTDRGLFWVNNDGLWRGGRKLLSGNFQRVLALEERILALGLENGVYWPDEEEISLPPNWIAADAADDIYFLTPAGLHRYDPAGYEIGFYPGSFSDLAVDKENGVWLAASGSRVVHLTPELEEAW